MTPFDHELRLRVGHMFIESIAAETERDRLDAAVKVQAEELARLRNELEAFKPSSSAKGADIEGQPQATTNDEGQPQAAASD